MRILPVLTLLACIALSAITGAQSPGESTTRPSARQVELDQIVEQQLEVLTTQLHLRIDQRATVRELLDAEVRHKYARLQHADKVTLSSARVLPPTVPGAPKRAPAARQPANKRAPAAQKQPTPKTPVAKKPVTKKPAAHDRARSTPDAAQARAARPRPDTSAAFLGEMRTTSLDKLRRWLTTSQRDRFTQMLGPEGQQRLEQLSQQRQAAWREVGYGKQLAQPNIQRKAPRRASPSRGRPAAKKKGQRNNGRRRVVRRRPNNNGGGGSSGGSGANGGGNTRGGGVINHGGGSSNRPPREGRSKSGKPPR